MLNGELPLEHATEKFFDKKWSGSIRECKLEYLKSGKDPRLNPFLRKEIAESWIQSRNIGISPDDYSVYSYLSESELIEIQERNRLLIEVAKPLIDNFLDLAVSSGCKLQLYDNDCYFIAGNRLDTDEPPSGRIVRDLSTTAHKLSILYKKPFQTIGPEHYLTKLQDNICTSAPIFNEDGEVIGTLALIQKMVGDPLNLTILKAHSLGWISSLAIAIGSQYILQQNNNNLHKTNQILEATFELFDEGIVTLDPDGTIIGANREGCRILSLDSSKINSSKKNNLYNMFDYLPNRSSVLKILENKSLIHKKHSFIEEYISVNKKEKRYIISVIPVLKPDSSGPECIMLRLNHSEKINALVTSRSGASAKIEFKDIIGQSHVLAQTKDQARRFAEAKENILLLGESGTGKELFAQAIHNYSRPNGPFIAVNCAAMPRTLIESELFGYESGAFTGAEKNGRPGKIELANGGTLFLDEIGDMPYELQAVLLRVLQNKEVMRLGAKRSQKVDFRLIAATNKPLSRLVEEKLFREDLYFRLSVLTINIPRLAERGDDKFILADNFIEQYARRMGFNTPVLSPEAREVILGYNWPGNVRELENAIIFALNMSDHKMIGIQHLPATIPLYKINFEAPMPNYTVKPLTNSQVKDLSSIKDIEKTLIEEAIAKTGSRMAKAAKLLGVSKATLYRKAKKYNIPYREIV